MLRPSLALLAAAPATAIAFAFAGCSSSSDGGTPTGDAGADAAASASYTPQGCSYQVSFPATRAATDVVLDDGKASTDATAALRVRIGLGGGIDATADGYANPRNSAVVTWETASVADAVARVRIGTSASAMSDVHTGASFTVDNGRFHEVHLCGLADGTTYYYQVGGGNVWSTTQTFTTIPKDGPITVGVSGDSRDDSGIFQMVQERMRDANVAMQLYTGDLIFFGSEETQFQTWLDKAWKDPNDASKFLTLGQQMILAVAGNHEDDQASYFANFALPGSGDDAETHASFDVGSAHVVLLDDQPIATAPTGDVAKGILAWLDQDLTHADGDRDAHPFVVVVHHRGEASTSTHQNDADVKAMRAALGPIWDKHHVDLVLNGHDHEYERSNPVSGIGDAPTVQMDPKKGTTYVICAGAGATAYPPGTTPVPYRAKNAGFGSGTGYVGLYGTLKIDAAKLTWTAYGLKAGGGSVMGDDVVDTFDLNK